MSGAWSVTDGPQSDYESLRAAILEGRSLPDLALRCFERQGLAGLILRLRGRIALGHRTSDPEASVVEFSCE